MFGEKKPKKPEVNVDELEERIVKASIKGVEDYLIDQGIIKVPKIEVESTFEMPEPPKPEKKRERGDIMKIAKEIQKETGMKWRDCLKAAAEEMKE